MSSKNFNFKVAIIGTTALTLLSAVTPNKAQAGLLHSEAVNSLSTSVYQPKFSTRLNTPDSNPNNNAGLYKKAIASFSILKSPPLPPVTVPNSRRAFLDLKTIAIYSNSSGDSLPNLPDDLSYAFNSSNFSNYSSATIYEYSFFVPNFNQIPLDPSYQPFPYDESGYVKWYVPSQFTYTSSGKTFSIDFGNGNSAPLSTNLLNSLGGLKTILATAKQQGIAKVSFPYHVNLSTSSGLSTANSVSASVALEATAIPEPNSSSGIVVLGLAGGWMLYRRTIRPN